MRKPVIYTGSTGPTPIGELWAAVNEAGELARVEFGGMRGWGDAETRGWVMDTRRAEEACRQISEYLSGERREFELVIDWTVMGEFQRAALQATCSIPYGCTSTYHDLACQIGRPLAARAVGRAEATNPMPLVIPCHRVVGRDGKLHGYGGPGGIALKEWLLQMENRIYG